jgi:acyl-CoA synthetase (AMP-forming)/AMP-acid ligase II
VARIEHILRDGCIRFVAAHESFEDYVRERLPAVCALATRALEDAGAPGRRPGVPAADLAFVQYTSGSTTNPKGVALTHANIRAGMASIIDAIEVDEHDVNGQWIPLHHDMGLIGLLTGIGAGWSNSCGPRRSSFAVLQSGCVASRNAARACSRVRASHTHTC